MVKSQNLLLIFCSVFYYTVSQSTIQNDHDSLFRQSDLKTYHAKDNDNRFENMNKIYAEDNGNIDYEELEEYKDNKDLDIDYNDNINVYENNVFMPKFETQTNVSNDDWYSFFQRSERNQSINEDCGQGSKDDIETPITEKEDEIAILFPRSGSVTCEGTFQEIEMHLKLNIPENKFIALDGELRFDICLHKVDFLAKKKEDTQRTYSNIKTLRCETYTLNFPELNRDSGLQIIPVPILLNIKLPSIKIFPEMDGDLWNIYVTIEEKISKQTYESKPVMFFLKIVSDNPWWTLYEDASLHMGLRHDMCMRTFTDEKSRNTETHSFPEERIFRKVNERRNNTSKSVQYLQAPLPQFDGLERMLGPSILELDDNKKKKKTLLISFAGAKGIENINNIVNKFGLEYFSFILFVYDESEWIGKFWWVNHPHVTIIYRKKQMKWWYVKHFLNPSIVENSYEYVFVIDEDCDVNGFDPLHFLDQLRYYNVEIGQPSQRYRDFYSHDTHLTLFTRLLTSNRRHMKEEEISTCKNASYHLFQDTDEYSTLDTRRQFLHHGIAEDGIWSTYTEGGPLIAFHHSIFSCIWSKILQWDLSSGFGIDLSWTYYCTEKQMAGVIRSTSVSQLGLRTASNSISWHSESAGEGVLFLDRFLNQHGKGIPWQVPLGFLDEHHMKGKDLYYNVDVDLNIYYRPEFIGVTDGVENSEKRLKKCSDTGNEAIMDRNTDKHHIHCEMYNQTYLSSINLKTISPVYSDSYASNSIAGFVHLGLEDEKQVKIGTEAFHSIDKSGLLNITDNVFLSALGSKASIFTEEVLNKQNYPYTSSYRSFISNSKDHEKEYTRSKFKLHVKQRDINVQGQINAMQNIRSYCINHPETKYIWFMHHSGGTPDLLLHKRLFINTGLYFIVERWIDCYKQLHLYGQHRCGALFYDVPQYFAGNYWWATCESIKALDDPLTWILQYQVPGYKQKMKEEGGNSEYLPTENYLVDPIESWIHGRDASILTKNKEKAKFFSPLYTTSCYRQKQPQEFYAYQNFYGASACQLFNCKIGPNATCI